MYSESPWPTRTPQARRAEISWTGGQVLRVGAEVNCVLTGDSESVPTSLLRPLGGLRRWLVAHLTYAIGEGASTLRS